MILEPAVDASSYSASFCPKMLMSFWPVIKSVTSSAYSWQAHCDYYFIRKGQLWTSLPDASLNRDRSAKSFPHFYNSSGAWIQQPDPNSQSFARTKDL